MTILVKTQNLFSPAAIAETMKRLPALKSTFLSEMFPKRKPHPTIDIALAELSPVVGTLPLVSRQGSPVPFGGLSQSGQRWVPQPLKPSLTISAADLNDQALIWGSQISRNQYVENQIDALRTVVHNTTEAMASVVATTGKLVWPSRIEGGGVEAFEIDFGPVTQKNPAVKWNDASTPPELEDVYEYLADLEQTVSESGGGGSLKFFAGQSAFRALLRLARLWQSTAGGRAIEMKLENGAINIGGYVISHMTERYQDPISGAWVNKLAAGKLLGYAATCQGTVHYLAVDSISAGNQAKDFHVVVKETADDSALNVIAQAKPLPVRDPKAQIIGEVCNP